MKNKLLLATLAVLALGASSGLRAQAPAPAAAPSSSWTITPAVVSQYMLRGVRLGGLSAQPVIEYTSGPVTAGLWNNIPLADRVPGQSNPEIDPYASYTMELAKDLTFQPGFILYLYPAARKKDGFYKMTFEPSVALNYTIEGIKLTPKLYYDTVLKQTLIEGSVAYSVPLKEIGTELSFLGQWGTFKAKDILENSSPATKNWGEYWLAGVTLPFQLDKQSKLSVGWAYTKGRDNFLKTGNAPKSVNTSAVGRGVVTVAYSFSL
ncbi:MAG: TorF family putative porin [Opitutaceae bacterium]|nr:TorF family putative porin [Opitutaceae bacterium]